MSEKTITRVSLDELRARNASGDVLHDPDAPETEDLGREFWRNAEAVLRTPETKSIHLKVDKEVFDFFKAAGKGHLTRMQNVLRAYVEAHRRSHG